MNFRKYRKYKAIVFFAITSLVLLGFTYGFIDRIVYKNFKELKLQNINKQVNYLKESISNIMLIRERQLQTVFTSAEAIVDVKSRIKIVLEDSVAVKTKLVANGSLETKYVPVVLKDSQEILGDKELPKKIRKLTNGHFNIYVRVKDGYVQVLDNYRNRGAFLPEFIHLSNPVAQSIERGVNYQERVVTDYDSRIFLYKPLKIAGKLRGCIRCGIDEGISGYLSKTFKSNKNSDENLFLIKSDGTPILRNKISDAMRDPLLLQALFNSRSNYSEIYYRFFNIENPDGVLIYYAYIPETDMYAGITVPDNTFNNPLGKSNGFIILVFVAVGIVVIAWFYFFVMQYMNRYNAVIASAQHLAVGEIAEAKYKAPKNSSGESLLLIANYLDKLTGFAKSILENNSDNDYEPAPFDLPGQAILELKKQKERAREKRLIRKFTSDLKKKTDNGKNAINDMLQYASEIKSMALKVIKIIYEVLEVDQIGFFLLTEHDEKQYLELKAAFAYNEERFFEEKIPAKDSLIGRAVIEKESFLLKDLPKEYTKISGGFGEINPKTLAIIPLIFNSEIQAVIEIASIKEIQSYQIKFIEEIGENIASTISNIKNSKQLEKLLLQTKEQSKQIDFQRAELEEKITTHRRQNRRIDKALNEKIEIINSIKKAAFLIELNLYGEVMSINTNMLDLFDADLESWINKRHRDFVVCENYIDEYGGFFRDISKGMIKYKIETISLQKNKSIKFSVIYSPVRNARGRISSILLMAQKTEIE